MRINKLHIYELSGFKYLLVLRIRINLLHILINFTYTYKLVLHIRIS